MRNIILDTNFLMIPLQFKVDIFSEIERICNFNYSLLVIEASVKELENIAGTGKSKDRKAAATALKLLKSKGIGIIKSEEKYADDAILKSADETTIVATQDMALKRKLAQKRTSIIILRQKKYLQLIERKPL